jgi:hypothetical protein
MVPIQGASFPGDGIALGPEAAVNRSLKILFRLVLLATCLPIVRLYAKDASSRPAMAIPASSRYPQQGLQERSWRVGNQCEWSPMAWPAGLHW